MSVAYIATRATYRSSKLKGRVIRRFGRPCGLRCLPASLDAIRSETRAVRKKGHSVLIPMFIFIGILTIHKDVTVLCSALLTVFCDRNVD